MQLIIKATSLEEAKKFASEHKITITNGDVIHSTEVICQADNIYRNKTIMWFCGGPDKAPYPMGTLLWHD